MLLGARLAAQEVLALNSRCCAKPTISFADSLSAWRPISAVRAAAVRYPKADVETRPLRIAHQVGACASALDAKAASTCGFMVSSLSIHTSQGLDDLFTEKVSRQA